MLVVHSSCSKLQCGILQTLLEFKKRQESDKSDVHFLPISLIMIQEIIVDLRKCLQEVTAPPINQSKQRRQPCLVLRYFIQYMSNLLTYVRLLLKLYLEPSTEKFVEWSLNRLVQFIQVAYSANQLKFPLGKLTCR